ncbi:MAG: hypothetical protein J0H15_03850 [Xanthomonadales bacterium]|nr:hypothetical protein [Xanthomonadales bacterium]
MPPSTLRRSLWAWCAALLLLAAASLPAAALPAAGSLQVRLARPSAALPDAARQVVVQGRAPAHCAPAIGSVGLDGADLSIELVSPQTGCDARRLVGFALAVDPRAAAGLPFLPERVLRVRLFARGSGPAELVAFRLLDASPAGAASVPENGFWWSQPGPGGAPASPGTGASFEWQGGQLAVGLFGFSDSGAATWSFGSARSVGRTASVALVELADGDPAFAPAGSQPSAEAGPRLEIEFLSPISARAWLVRQEDGRDVEVRPLTLARSRFDEGPAGTAWSGRWVLVGDETAPPRLFEFGGPRSQDADSFHLDAADGASLECRLAAATRQPDLCTLTADGLSLADFDEVGLDRLGGRDPGGQAVRLVRVPR